MSSSERIHPTIPDHDVLRKIGGGAYGEVWLARSVTGAMRAVKFVWRADFQDDRTFEREFDGLLKYEPVSRDHPGLVHVLHVGRSPDETSFYYYVMELGDDAESGQEINPVEYEARTLRSESSPHERLPTAQCIEVGISLACALEHLHSCGLAHRDVKPSNIIFIHGQAKLADIGLVAARGQQTFVGTEGFVPPEGPGSAQADVYSLGKVLYEIATGKDRLDFPDLPDEVPPEPERISWLQLNEVICKVCEPRKERRGIITASHLAKTLTNLKHGIVNRKPSPLIWITGCLFLIIASVATWFTLNADKTNLADGMSPIVQTGLLRLITTPDDAEVYSSEGELLGVTPTATGMLKAPIGSQVSYEIRKKGYLSQTISTTVTAEAVKEPTLLFLELENFTPPQEGSIWVDHLGMTYLPVGDKHLTARFIPFSVWEQFLKETGKEKTSGSSVSISEEGQPTVIALANEEEVQEFTEWMRKHGLAKGFLTKDHQIIVEFDQLFASRLNLENSRKKPFHLLIGKYTYGGVALSSSPAGAEAFVNGISAGSTEDTLLIQGLKPGKINLTLVLEGYAPSDITTHISAGVTKRITAILRKNGGVVFGKPWQNSIQMKFVPISSTLMASAYETTVANYQSFLTASAYVTPEEPDFEQAPNHPVVSVSREDAIAFCEWLTAKERAENRLSTHHIYRLPTDAEWSLIAGLEFEIGEGPGQKDANKPRSFPWAGTFPPPPYFANYADRAAVELPGVNTDRFIQSYDDGFSRTAPVGSYAPNQNGLYDISGNAHEWVSDDIFLTKETSLGVLRGGGWNTYLQENLFLGWRNPVPSKFHASYYGFRVILAKDEIEK